MDIRERQTTPQKQGSEEEEGSSRRYTDGENQTERAGKRRVVYFALKPVSP